LEPNAPPTGGWMTRMSPGADAERRREVHLVVVRILRLGPDRQLAVVVEVGDRARRPHAAVRHVVRAKHVVDDEVGSGLGRGEVAVRELEVQALVAGEVRRARAARPSLRSGLGREDARQVFVLDLDQRRSRCSAISSVSAATAAISSCSQRTLSLSAYVVANEAELEAGGVLAGQHRVDAGQLLGGCGVDANDSRVRAAGEQHLADQHLRQHHVVDVARLAGGLVGRIGLLHALADQGLRGIR